MKINKVSIITVVLNGSKTIEKTIQSVICQDYPDFEFIVIDGGSTDGTVDIIKRYSDSIDYWVSEPDNGIYDAMNKGIRKAQGKWLYFLNAGDILADGILFTLEDYFNDNLTSVIYGDICLVNGKKKEICRALPLDCIICGNAFCHQASFVRNTGENVFDTSYKIAADYKVFLYKYLNREKFRRVPYTIADYSMDGVSSDYYRTWIEIIEVASELLYDFSVFDSNHREKLISKYVQIEEQKQLEKAMNYQRLKGYLDEVLPQNKSIILFGTGDIAKRFEGFIAWGHYNVSCFIDNDKEKQGMTFMERPIHNVDYLCNMKQQVVIIMSEKYNKEMLEDIRRLNLDTTNSVYDFLDLRREYEKGQTEKMLEKAMSGLPNFARYLRAF